MDHSPPASSVHGILQARILPFPPPGDHLDPGFKPASLTFYVVVVEISTALFPSLLHILWFV